jgi:hypothetical protein
MSVSGAPTAADAGITDGDGDLRIGHVAASSTRWRGFASRGSSWSSLTRTGSRDERIGSNQVTSTPLLERLEHR